MAGINIRTNAQILHDMHAYERATFLGNDPQRTADETMQLYKTLKGNKNMTKEEVIKQGYKDLTTMTNDVDIEKKYKEYLTEHELKVTELKELAHAIKILSNNEQLKMCLNNEDDVLDIYPNEYEYLHDNKDLRQLILNSFTHIKNRLVQSMRDDISILSTLINSQGAGGNYNE